MSMNRDRYYEHDANLVGESLCREISNAKRWSHVMDAWRALVNMRRLQDNLRNSDRTRNAEGTGKAQG